ncbi:MAG: hypothetical protein ABJC66_07745 [Gammaproteobacteria bacterium]
MNHKLLLLGALGLTAALVAACHDRTAATTPPPAPPPTSQSLDTAQVLALAQHTSETASPIAVNDGALTLNDTSETTTPIAVAAM